MQAFLNSEIQIGSLKLPNRLIQGPLAGFSCAPFRSLFSSYEAPAYCVSEMISAHDVIHKHPSESRYLFRSPTEKLLCYQIAGNDPELMAEAAQKLAALGADLIDINCGCPKTKIRKKGAGSALLEHPERLQTIVKAVRAAIQCPLTVKIRLQDPEATLALAENIVDSGADALIVHGRRWTDDYAIPCDLSLIAQIKQRVSIPVIMNGDLADQTTLHTAWKTTGCDAYMISRAGTGKPWLYQALLNNETIVVDLKRRIELFLQHLQGLRLLENDFQAVLQSRSLVKYYFRDVIDMSFLPTFYRLQTLADIDTFIRTYA